MKPAEATLIDAARAGDRAALEELLARYEPRIYRFGLRMCGDEEAAREVLQETLLAAFRNLPGFRGDASLSTWLYQIAHNRLTDHWRSQSHRPVAPEDAMERAEREPDPQTPERQLSAFEERRRLQLALEELPAD